jgi:hypothetical protein
MLGGARQRRSNVRCLDRSHGGDCLFLTRRRHGKEAALAHNRDNSRQSSRRRFIEREQSRSGCRRADHAPKNHPRQPHILQVARFCHDLFGLIDALNRFPDGFVVAGALGLDLARDATPQQVGFRLSECLMIMPFVQ